MMGYLAQDIMSPNVIVVEIGMDLRDLAKMFLAKGISGAPVVDDQGELVGVISQTDLIYYNLTRDDELVMDSHFYQSARMEGAHVPRGFQIEDTNTGSVGDAMTPVVHSVTTAASVESVARMMTRKHIHRVIVRSGRKVAGIISALDVLRSQHKSPASKSTRKKTTKKKTAPRSRPRRSPSRAR